MNIYQSNTYWKYSNCLLFDDDSRVQEKQRVWEQIQLAIDSISAEMTGARNDTCSSNTGVRGFPVKFVKFLWTAFQGIFKMDVDLLKFTKELYNLYQFNVALLRNF